MNERSPTEDLPSPQLLAERAFATLQRFLHVEAVSGCVLLMAAVAALVWANSPLADSYHALWHQPVSIQVGPFVFSRPLHFWINDALMTVFFLVVGMEIRREAHEGALSRFDQAALPVIAAAGGVIAPALIYLSLNTDAVRGQGWAVPTATDIAFAVGVLVLLGRSIPVNLRVFLLALAAVTLAWPPAGSRKSPTAESSRRMPSTSSALMPSARTTCTCWRTRPAWSWTFRSRRQQ